MKTGRQPDRWIDTEHRHTHKMADESINELLSVCTLVVYELGNISSLVDGPGNDDNSPHFTSAGLLLIELSSIGSLCFWQLLIVRAVCVCVF